MVKILIYRICHGPAGGSDENDGDGPAASAGSISRIRGFPKTRLMVCGEPTRFPNKHEWISLNINLSYLHSNKILITLKG